MSTNSTVTPLAPGGTFTGTWEARTTNCFLDINVFADSNLSITVQQAALSQFIQNTQTFAYDATLDASGILFQVALVPEYFRVIATNTSAYTQTYNRVTSRLNNVNVDVGANAGPLVVTGAVSVTNLQDISGITVVSDISGQTLNVGNFAELVLDLSGQYVHIQNWPETIYVAGTVSVSNLQDASGITVISDISGQTTLVGNFAELVTDLSGQFVHVDNFPASQAVTVSGCPPVQMLGSLTQTNAVFLDGAVSDSIAQISVTDGYLSIAFTGPTAFTNGQSILLSAVSALPQLTGRVYQIFYQVSSGQTLVISTPDLANVALTACTGLVQSVRVTPILCTESGSVLVDISGQDVHVNNLQDISGVTVVTDISGQFVHVDNFPAEQVVDVSGVVVTSSQLLNNLNATYSAGAVQGTIIACEVETGVPYVILEFSSPAEFFVGQQVVVAGCTTFPQLNGVRTIVIVYSSTAVAIHYEGIIGNVTPSETGSVSSYGSSPLLADVSGNLLVKVEGSTAVSGSVSLLAAADPTLCVGTVRLTDVYGQPIVTTGGLLMVTIAGINTNAPLHTIVDSATGTTLAYSNIELSNTGQVVSAAPATIRQFSAQNSNATNQYIKIYNKATAATAADTPIFTFLLPSSGGVSYELNHLFSLGISVRATFLPAVADNTAAANYVFTNFTYSV